MKHVSLFAGIGGFDLGFERAGMECVYQVEIDKNCRTVLAHHWPNVERGIADVKEFGKSSCGGTVDLVSGGFPCQDVSVAGRREGLAGKRSGLWFEFIRIIEELGPKWVVVENVPGLLSSHQGRDLAAILSGLEECGYWWAYRILDAQYFGVAQRRRRVFIIGCLAKGRAQEVLFERESSPWDTAPSREAGKEVASYAVSGIGDYRQHKGTLRHHGGDCGGGSEVLTIVQHALSGNNQRNDPDGEHFVVEIHGGSKRKDRPEGSFYVREMPTTEPLDTSGLNPNCAQGGVGVVEALPDYKNPVETTGYQGDVVIPETGTWTTLSAESSNLGGGGNAILHACTGVRRLTPTECERLQGFPDGWTAINGMKDSPRYRMLGNAVCVNVAEWIGKRIMMVEGK